LGEVVVGLAAVLGALIIVRPLTRVMMCERGGRTVIGG
jgi:hypothetical protein